MVGVKESMTYSNKNFADQEETPNFTKLAYCIKQALALHIIIITKECAESYSSHSRFFGVAQ